MCVCVCVCEKQIKYLNMPTHLLNHSNFMRHWGIINKTEKKKNISALLFCLSLFFNFLYYHCLLGCLELTLHTLDELSNLVMTKLLSIIRWRMTPSGTQNPGGWGRKCKLWEREREREREREKWKIWCVHGNDDINRQNHIDTLLSKLDTPLRKF